MKGIIRSSNVYFCLIKHFIFLYISDELGSSVNLFMRKNDDDFDPEAMDKHDSFYHTTKSLLVLFQIMGIMPIMRSPKGYFITQLN